MSLADKDTGMVNALGKSKLEDLCLKPPLQEILYLQTQDVIELHLTLIEHTDPHQTPEQGITWQTKQKLVRKPEDRYLDFTVKRQFWPH